MANLRPLVNKVGSTGELVDTDSLLLPSATLPDGVLTSEARAELPVLTMDGKTFAPRIFDRNRAFILAGGSNSSGYHLAGLPIPAATGAATGTYQASTNLYTRTRRVKYVSNAAAGSVAGPRIGGNIMTVGDGSGIGGFFFSVVFGCGDAATVSGARQFIGISGNSSAPTNVEPSTLVKSFGVGHGAADTNLFIYPSGGSAAQTPIDLGANFPANTLSTDMYKLTLYSPSDVATTIHYRVERLGTSHVAEGTVVGTSGADMWTTSDFICPLWGYRTNNATALAVSLDLSSVELEGNF